jgi:hypothetical protein
MNTPLYKKLKILLDVGVLVLAPAIVELHKQVGRQHTSASLLMARSPRDNLTHQIWIRIKMFPREIDVRIRPMNHSTHYTDLEAYRIVIFRNFKEVRETVVKFVGAVDTHRDGPGWFLYSDVSLEFVKSSFALVRPGKVELQSYPRVKPYGFGKLSVT